MTHLKPDQNALPKRLHLSHLMQYVSAYEPSERNVKQLAEDIEGALKKAKDDKDFVIVGQDSPEFFFVVTPSGSINLCIVWKSFVVDRES